MLLYEANMGTFNRNIPYYVYLWYNSFDIFLWGGIRMNYIVAIVINFLLAITAVVLLIASNNAKSKRRNPKRAKTFSVISYGLNVATLVVGILCSVGIVFR